MSVLLVTDDADDDISTHSKENFYKQLKDLEYDFSFTSYSIVESLSILVQSNQHYRQQRRRRRRRCCRWQQCWVQPLLTYMFTLLFLTNHLHWPVIILSISSLKIMSTQASTTISKRPFIAPSIVSPQVDEQHCLPLDNFSIDRICSKTCRIPKLLSSNYDDYNPLLGDQHFLPFCSNLLNQTIIQKNFFNQTTEDECRRTLEDILKADNEARKATELFATYMKAIDSASEENRYSIINANCQNAYRMWACSVQIPFYYQDQLIPPCHSICDEVERACPTFRPSDREPLFAGQPLFFCHGGIVRNNDYGQRPHCFDSCHLSHGSLQRPSTANKSSISVEKFVEYIVTTPPCFEIQPYSSSFANPTSISFLPNESILENQTNSSLSSSAVTSQLRSSLLSMLTFIFLQIIVLTTLVLVR